ncbi:PLASMODESMATA CALLOSE-BINDING PROTEIN 2-like [Cornus florida]|uniref:PLASMODESMATA CALLOSE-BINDING PROTEIN 2-like n=1 Tax=Cornus florida TaxID=4283 RepID=UPI00289680AD|nr:PLASMODESMATA CALLOSE-BINDING PROTEIN 2-like [Cornus florida]
MGARVFQCSILFIFSLFCISDSGIAEKSPPEAILQNQKLDHQENQTLFTYLNLTTQIDDTIPIIIPTPPTTTTPTIATSPPPPMSTTPTTTTPATNTPASSGGAWCIASPTASPTGLQVALDYACGYGGADCSAIQPAGSCYNPNTVRDHASYAFNDYYQKNPIPTSCVFGGVAQLTYTDPSTGNCHYATPIVSSSTSSSNSPPTPISSAYPGTPSEPTDYGSTEPTGSPNSADSAMHNLMLLFAATCLSVFAANSL